MMTFLLTERHLKKHHENHHSRMHALFNGKVKFMVDKKWVFIYN